jgi:predicted peptidase
MNHMAGGEEIEMKLQRVSRPAQSRGEELLIFLHGAGEIGGNIDAQVRKSGPWEDVIFAPRGQYHPDAIAEIRSFHVLGFHLRANDWDAEILNDAINEYVRSHSSIDSKKLYVAGISRGGRGALRLALRRVHMQEPITAVAAFCPEGGKSGFAKAELVLLRNVPIFLFHCPEDKTVPFVGSAMLHESIGSSTSKLRIIHTTELVDAALPHVCWTQIFGHPDLYPGCAILLMIRGCGPGFACRTPVEGMRFMTSRAHLQPPATESGECGA